MGLFNSLRDSRTVREALKHVEPMLRGMEARDRLFDSAFSPAKARCKSATVLANDPFLLGFIDGLVFGFVTIFGAGPSEKRTLDMTARATVALFPGRAEGLDLIVSARATNARAAEYIDGAEKGLKLVQYSFGADYSNDPDATEAIGIGHKMDKAMEMPATGGERGDLIGGMQWMYFTGRFTKSRHSAARE